MQDAVEHWRKSAEGKLGEVQQQFRNLLETYPKITERPNAERFEDILRTLQAKTDALIDHFGPGLSPDVLTHFRARLHHWVNNRASAPIFLDVVRAADRLPSILEYPSSKQPEFTATLDLELEKPEIEEALSELIAHLERLLKAAEDTIAARAERDILRILENLRGWKQKRFLDLVPWVDFAGKAAAAFANAHHATPLYALGWELVKIAARTHATLRVVFDRAEGEFSLRLGMPFLAAAQSEFARLPSEGEADAALKRAELPERGQER